MTTPVLFDLPGPKARARQRIGTVIGAVVIAAIIVFVLVRLGRNGQLEGQRWAVLFDPNSGVPQALGNLVAEGSHFPRDRNDWHDCSSRILV